MMTNSDMTNPVADLLKRQSNNFSYTYGHVHEFYITGTIESADEYTEWFHTIRNANATDVVKLHINSPGGDLWTAIQFVHVLAETEATIQIVVEGACMSAATLLFLMGHEFEVSPHAMFMIHNYSGGSLGKGGEMYDNIVHERKWSENLLHDAYDGFLTQDEIKSVLDNKDLWMGTNEVLERLEKRQGYLENLQSLKEAAIEAELKSAEKPKKAARKPKKATKKSS
jgi:ATP-dependent Clp protease, protease subunit